MQIISDKFRLFLSILNSQFSIRLQPIVRGFAEIRILNSQFSILNFHPVLLFRSLCRHVMPVSFQFSILYSQFPSHFIISSIVPAGSRRPLVCTFPFSGNYCNVIVLLLGDYWVIIGLLLGDYWVIIGLLKGDSANHRRTTGYPQRTHSIPTVYPARRLLVFSGHKKKRPEGRFFCVSSAFCCLD